MPFPTFRAIAERWLFESAGSVSVKTIEHYRWLLENYVYPRFGETLEIAEEEVRAFVEEKREQGLSANTVYVLPKLISRVLSYASSEGLCEAPNWEFGKGRPNKESKTVILSDAQERQLLAWLTENPSSKHLALFLILTTGMSVLEMMALTWADVSFSLNRIRVLMEKETTPDTRNKYRNVPINERQKLYLKKLASLPSCYVASGKPKQLTPYTLRDRLLHACKETMLPEMTLTDLRRTFAVHRLEEGMTYEQVAKTLGQNNDRNFRSFYSSLVSEDTRKRLEKDQEASRKIPQRPKTNRSPEKEPEIKALESKIDARKKELKETLASLEGDLSIIRALRKSDCVQGAPREGLYRLIEQLLGDDRDGKALAEYLRCNMRVAAMPSRHEVTVQTLRARISRGFAKLCKRLEEIEAKITVP